MKTSLTRPLLSVRGASPRCLYRAHSSLAERLQHEMTTRKIPLFYDYLYPQPSHLLNLTLCDLLLRTGSCSIARTATTLPSITNPSPLPIGHHLIYFPPQVTLSQLLPDGTDILHTPGDPFTRRLWAGGNVRFPAASPLLDGQRAVCIESIRNVSVKGREGDEKVIVTIERRIGTVPEGESESQTWDRIWTKDEALAGEAAVIENRDLIFMRSKSGAQIAADQALFGKPGRIVKAPSGATLRHTITPRKSLLFRFSALTFNAHSIHLDQSYTQNQEGYRNLLVHGPLTLTLLLSVLEQHLRGLGLRVDHIEYKNLAPLFVDEALAVCGKPKNGGGAWDVWIEGPDGGLAVRGTVKTCALYGDDE
ncbi:uncharacterized protein N7482_004732 [Penicillium canariense]|uniref:Uncharacterized protein n=1 Tax=Penicillium canariense TaxID=189055 RepID=A0A9W9I998_9EURO|nr:uncharacterized protein N7482_004732 [Penicillium canariense]KAJ5169138.1 hypothetical protein N7482_004732 [Penicillium canariense]